MNATLGSFLDKNIIVYAFSHPLQRKQKIANG